MKSKLEWVRGAPLTIRMDPFDDGQRRNWPV